MSTIYILVADDGRARVYRTERPLRAESVLDTVYEAIHYEGSRKRADIDSDRPGVQRSGSGGFHGLGGDRDSGRHEEEGFARGLCQWLSKAQASGGFSELILAAPPRLLGDLRKHLDPACRAALSKSLDKDLLQFSGPELVRHLQAGLSAA